MDAKSVYGRIRPYLKRAGVLSIARRVASPEQRRRLAEMIGLRGFSPPVEAIRTGRFRGKVSLKGINYLTDMRANIGLGESARMIFRAAQASGIPVSYQEVVTPAINRGRELPAGAEAHSVCYDLSLIHLIPSEMPFAVDTYPGSFKRSYNIGFWLWEVPRFPEGWYSAFELLDEVWTPSTYTQAILSQISPVPVNYIPIPLEVRAGQGTRHEFDLPDDRYIFFFTFNPTSSMARKNPYGLIEAYRRAFVGSDNPPLLVIKTHHLDAAINAPIAESLRQAVREVGGILIERDFSRQQMNDLLSVCDCYVSLHRAEGFGLGIAESMALGKPVIATAYSANTDFMRPENSFGVNYTLREITPDDHTLQPFLLDIYKAQPGQVWAEPDLDHAADLMRYVYTHPDEARKRGQIAQQDIAEGWSVDAVGKRIRERLSALAV